MKVLGVGTDITECLRIAQMIERHGELFVERVMTAYALWNEQVILRPEWNYTQQAAALQKVMDDEIPLVAPAPMQHMCIVDLRGMQI